MFHAETGVFKTSYAADAALFPLPIARKAMIAIAVLFVIVVPFGLDEYYLSILNLRTIARVLRVSLPELFAENPRPS